MPIFMRRPPQNPLRYDAPRTAALVVGSLGALHHLDLTHNHTQQENESCNKVCHTKISICVASKKIYPK